MSARRGSVSLVPDRGTARGLLIHRIELRARDYLVGEIGPSKWIRWGRLMGLVEVGAIHGYRSAQMVQRVGDAAWHMQPVTTGVRSKLPQNGQLPAGRLDESAQTAVRHLGFVCSKHAEFVAFGIGQGRPLETHLLICAVRQARGPKSDETLDIGLAVVRIPIEVPSVLRGLPFRDPHEEQVGIAGQRGPMVPTCGDFSLQHACPEAGDVPWVDAIDDDPTER